MIYSCRGPKVILPQYHAKRTCNTKTNHFFSASEKQQPLSTDSPAESAVQRRKISATDILSLLQKSLNQHFFHFEQREKSSTASIMMVSQKVRLALLSFQPSGDGLNSTQ